MLVTPALASSQTAAVTTTGTGVVQLQWTPDTAVSRIYLIYRKLPSDRAFPASPLARIGRPSCSVVTQRLLDDTVGARILWALSGAASDANILDVQQRVCDLITGDVQLPAFRQMARIASANWRVARLCGSWFEDATARKGTEYVYEIRVAEAGSTERVIHPNKQLRIMSGGGTILPQIGGLQAIPGDGRIQVTWLRSDLQAPCVLSIERSTSRDNWNRALVREIMPLQLQTTIDGAPLSEQIQSYIDQGSAQEMLVVGQTYHYRLRWLAANGVAGPYSSILSVKPIDRTPPAAAQQLRGVASKETGSVTITWNKSYFDVNGRREKMGSYRIYRLAVNSVNILDGELIATVDANNAEPTDNMLTYIDRQPAFDPCRTVSTTYMIIATDSAGNSSSQSAPLSIRLDDRVPPERVKEFRWMSDQSIVQLKWQANTDCGVQRYNIYRALCDYGRWNPCDEDSDSITAGTYRQAQEKAARNSSNRVRGQRSTPQECGGPFMFLGSVEHTTPGIELQFNDESIPDGSPLCYAYVISVQDSSGNQSVKFPVPDPILDQVLCANLVDRVAPLPPSITRLGHDENRITVHARTVPVQDLMGFHLYRTADTNSPYTFIKAQVLDIATMKYAEQAEKYTYSESSPPLCELIPQGALVRGMSVAFTDDSVVPYVPYWYKVTAVDRGGNESALTNSANQGTLTYGRKDLDSAIVTVEPDETGNRMVISVSCNAPSETIDSYAVFRASSRDGQYRQLGVESYTPTFVDRSVLRGASYWYKAIVFFKDNRYTNLSSPAEGVLP